MVEIIDLDVFAPAARSVKFTDRAGKVITLRLEDMRKRLEAKGLFSAFRAAGLRLRIAQDERELKKHLHIFDVTFMSFRSSMFMLEHLEEFRALTQVEPEKVSEKEYRLILSVIAEIGSKTDKEMTVDFLFDNLSVQQGIVLLGVALKPIMEFVISNPPGAASAEATGK